MKLTKLQKAAVEAAGKNILVAAGAGTGKTRVLVERFIHLVVHHHIPVTEILTLTFTEKAANEMKSRILQRFGELGLDAERRQLESAYISTIHAFAARLLKDHPVEAGLDPDFRVVEPEEAGYLKELALDEALEERCEVQSPVFELLQTYGETLIRHGLLNVLNAARHEGLCLSDFFERYGSEAYDDEPAGRIGQIFDLLEEDDLADEWKKWGCVETWDWHKVEEFKKWFKPFSRRGGKNNKELWRELSDLCKTLAALKVEPLAAPWKASFKTLAFDFERIYERLKKEKSFLDFDDLPMLAVRLFKKEGAAAVRLKESYRTKFRQIMIDEFQDTDFLQLELIELIACENNLFFVGDFKQSIYGFRGAEPEVFLSKEKSYQENGDGVRISLLENFRTSAGVLNWINRLFEHLWVEDEMNFEALFPMIETCSPDGVELARIKPVEGESLDRSRMQEAEFIARRILTLHEQGFEFGEVAVLFQAMTELGIYEQALKKYGIPYFAVSGRGFYHQPEIRDMVSYLAFLDNPLSDIPLAAVLRSPMFQISTDGLFWLARFVKDQKIEGSLYEGVKNFEQITELSDDDRKNTALFLQITQEILQVKDRLKLTELLDLILEKTSYELTVLTDSHGVRRYANLKKLISLTREFESYEPLSLNGYLHTLRQLETQEIRESEAQVEAEKSGRAVRLMSIHKAKGLEFKVVFVADLGRRRQSPESKTILSAAHQGFAMKVLNPLTQDWDEPAGWKRIDKQVTAKEKQEWKRLFYVAATRTVQRLILSGVYEEKEKAKESFYEMSSWMEWLSGCPAQVLPGLETFDVDPAYLAKKQKPFFENRTIKELLEEFVPKPFETLIPDLKQRKKIEKQTEEVLKGTRPVERQPSRVIDLSVSAYALYQKSKAEYKAVYEMGFPSDDAKLGREEPSGEETDDRRVTAAEFGTRMHKVLELLDFKKSENAVDLTEEIFKTLSSEESKEAVRIIRDFVQTPLCLRLAKAQVVKKEIPFILNERHGLIYGVIDVLFQDPDGSWHVLDYKTAEGSLDKLENSGYIRQIGLYALAVQEILGKSPATGILYFLKNKWQYVETFDPEKMNRLGPEIRNIQSDILEMRNRQLS
ncbi:MAG: UvrD-helicase domain-containing protein [Candidatus Omnitrophica bacterium]|nr:UvrD-helicase domain-containing protein [Candidatus Omnitrophota bacterium]